MTRRPKSKGLMPNKAAQELLGAIDDAVHMSVCRAEQEGVIREDEAELRRIRMHFARVDKWLSILDQPT